MVQLWKYGTNQPWASEAPRWLRKPKNVERFPQCWFGFVAKLKRHDGACVKVNETVFSWLREGTENDTTDSLWSGMTRVEWMNKHVMQYPHSSVCLCVFAEGQLCSPIQTNPPGTPHTLSLKHHYTQTLTDQYISLSLSIAKTVSMLKLTTQQALIPLPVTFYKQD